jgi:NTE family protein
MTSIKSSSDAVPWERDIGLVLPGGGARCAYQVGVLKAIAEMMPPSAPNPFPIVSGTSAGAINAAVIATRARRFKHSIIDLERVWGNFRTNQVFRSDSQTMIKTSLHWIIAIAAGGILGSNPKSLLDNDPLRALLQRYIKLSHIQQSIDRGYLDAIAVTAAGYGSARSVSFFQGIESLEPWNRVRRRGKREDLKLDHLMASIAAPLIFPPVMIGREFFGDGAMRQAAPLSPAIRLGAKRILVIGVRNDDPDPLPGPNDPVPFPSFGRVAGYMLDALLMDGLSADLERLSRLNRIVHDQPGRQLQGDSSGLRSIDAFIMFPSQDVREIALRYVHQMPRTLRIMLRGLGALNYGGRQLVSYLLFESGYTRALIRLGYEDAMLRSRELRAFMEGVPIDTPTRVSGWEDLSDEYSQRLPALKLGANAQGSGR